MPMVTTEKIWFNGNFVPWSEATVHVLSHALHYGTSFFEGARCYKTVRGSACFRIYDHVRRLYESLKIYRTKPPYELNAFIGYILDTIRVNKLEECYIRPIIFRGCGELGVNPAKCSIETVIAVWGWGAYLGAEALENGVNVCVSSWNRLAPNTMPNLAKVGANYMNSQLIKMEALTNGYDEGIGLDVNGMVSEGSGENIFIVRDGILYTTPAGASILAGITRDSVMVLAGEMGIPVREQLIPREMLYVADEVFFTGTAAEITPVASIDRIQVGDGRRGPITASLQKAFFDIVSGQAEDKHGWLTFI